MCRTRHFRSKGQCATEIQLLNTPHDRRCCRGHQAMTPLWCSSINTLWFLQKNCRVHVRGRGDMTTLTAIALDSSLNLLLISRILVNTNGNGQHHVIMALIMDRCVLLTSTPLCVVSPRGDHSGCTLVIARCGETTHSGVDVNNTHLFMINPLSHCWGYYPGALS